MSIWIPKFLHIEISMMDTGAQQVDKHFASDASLLYPPGTLNMVG